MKLKIIHFLKIVKQIYFDRTTLFFKIYSRVPYCKYGTHFIDRNTCLGIYIVSGLDDDDETNAGGGGIRGAGDDDDDDAQQPGTSNYTHKRNQITLKLYIIFN